MRSSLLLQSSELCPTKDNRSRDISREIPVNLSIVILTQIIVFHSFKGILFILILIVLLVSLFLSTWYMFTLRTWKASFIWARREMIGSTFSLLNAVYNKTWVLYVALYSRGWDHRTTHHEKLFEWKYNVELKTKWCIVDLKVLKHLLLVVFDMFFSLLC